MKDFCFLPVTLLLATRSNDTYIRLWNVEAQQVSKIQADTVTCMVPTTCGKYLMTGGLDSEKRGVVRILNIET